MTDNGLTIQNDITPVVFEHDGRVMASSRDVAEYFGKRHKDVLRRLDTLDCSMDFNRRNFAPVDYLDQKGEMRKAIEMTKDGFAFLVMGFTGKQAAAFKEQYIEAFNAMEQRLRSGETLPVDMKAVGGMVKGIVHKAIADFTSQILPVLIEQRMRQDPRVVAVDCLPALEVVKLKKVPAKGRKRIVLNVSNSLHRFCESHPEYRVTRDWSRRRLFDRAAIRHWEAEGGWAPIQTLIDETSAQVNLFVVQKSD